MELIHRYGFVIFYVIVMAVHYLLSRTGIKPLGFIVPVCVVGGLLYTYKTGDLRLNLLGTVIMIVISLLILLVEWEKAQKD